ncbi:hypothetical protein A2U01_0027338, partial [Trifolium medium]|nr:hypothetical protein [Trifolium medium]
ESWITCANERGGVLVGFAGMVETMHGQEHILAKRHPTQNLRC